MEFRVEVEAMVTGRQYNSIQTVAEDFFASTRYVLAHVIDHLSLPGLDIEWRSEIPVSSGLGSGAAASASMLLAVLTMAGSTPSAEKLIDTAWRGDIVAHGGVASSLDSSTIVHGGLVRYTVAEGAVALQGARRLQLVIGNATVPGRSTAKLNARVRRWLDFHPAKMHLFADMGFIVEEIQEALANDDLGSLGHLLNLHQLIQDKIGTSAAENERMIEAAMGGGALGAKISGAGGGGIMIALTESGRCESVANAIEEAGGTSFVATTGVAGVRVVGEMEWENMDKKRETNG